MPRLTDLPPEIRNIIYGMVLTDETTIVVQRRPYPEQRRSNSRALTHVSQEIRAECLPIYYSTNTFLLTSLPRDWDWLRVVGVNLQFLRHIKIRDDFMDDNWEVGKRRSNWKIFRVKFSVRLSNATRVNSALCKTEPCVLEHKKDLVCKIMKPMQNIMRQFGRFDVLFTGMVPPGRALFLPVDPNAA